MAYERQSLSIEEIVDAVSKKESVVKDIENSRLAQEILKAMQVIIANQGIKDPSHIQAGEVTKLVSAMNHQLREMGLHNKTQTSSLTSEIGRVIRDSANSGISMNVKEIATFISQEIYSAMLASYRVLDPSKAPINIKGAKGVGKEILESKNPMYVKEEDGNLITRATNKLINFLEDHYTEEEGKIKKRQAWFLAALIDGLAKNKFIGGAFKDGVKLFGYTLAAQLKAIGHPIAAAITVGLSQVLPPILVTAITTALQGRILASALGIGGGVGLGARMWAGIKGAGSKIGSLASGVAQNKWVQRLGGIAKSPEGRFLGVAGGALSMGSGALDIIAGKEEGEGSKVAGGALSVIGGGLLTAGALGLGGAFAPIIALLGGIITGLSYFKPVREFVSNIYRTVSDWFGWNKDKDKDKKGLTAGTYLSDKVQDLSKVVNVPVRGSKYIENVTESMFPKYYGKYYEQVYPEGIGERVPLGGGGGSGVSGVAALNPHVAKRIDGTTKGTHKDPLPKVDFVASRKYSTTELKKLENMYYSSTGIKVRFDEESEGNGRWHYDVATLSDPTGIRRKPISARRKSTMQELAEARSKKPIWQNGWLINAYELEKGRAAQAIAEAYNKDPKVREHYEWVKGANVSAASFQTDIYHPQLGAFVPKGTGSFLQKARSAGLGLTLTSGMGTAGAIYDESKFSQLYGASTTLSMTPQEVKKKEEKSNEVHPYAQAPSKDSPWNALNKTQQQYAQSQIQNKPRGKKLSDASVPGNTEFSKTYANLVTLANTGADSIRGS